MTDASYFVDGLADGVAEELERPFGTVIARSEYSHDDGEEIFTLEIYVTNPWPLESEDMDQIIDWGWEFEEFSNPEYTHPYVTFTKTFED